MLSTIHRRHILSFFESHKAASLSELKENFVGTSEMNQTTLYRILDKFIEEGIIHKAEFASEKYFTLCQCHKDNEKAVKLKCCVNCHSIEDAHTPLAPDAMKSETIELVKICNHCKK